METHTVKGVQVSPVVETFGKVTFVTKKDGRRVPFEEQKIYASIARACQAFEHSINVDMLITEVMRNIYEGIVTSEIEKAYILAACAFIEKDPAYNFVAARLLHQKLFREVVGRYVPGMNYEDLYRQAFIRGIMYGVEINYLDKRMLEYDLELLSKSLKVERDELFGYMGLHTLYERNFLKHDKKRFELPQAYWMRIAMGLALNEPHKHERVIEFYSVMSQLKYLPSTPTMFHAGFPTAQLSSCYLTTVDDDLHHIFKCLGDSAQLSKWAGGIGTDWTNIRGTGSFIKTIKATSQGVIPYLKIANDIVIAITKSGIRRGGMCVYLEVWHYDIEDFLDLKRNTGDERRRTHDINTAIWIPDLFMKRVQENGSWMLFSPNEVPDLHDLYGAAFEEKYLEYERQAVAGTIKVFKEVSATQLWRKSLTRLFETGHPWITFKDPCNIRSPQDHVGVVHSSNLCTEITLNTSDSETAVCNLGSLNLAQHIINGHLDEHEIEQTVRTAIRMLDNVIDLNFYPTSEAKNSNLRHRPVGLGLMGFQDALFKLNIPFSSQDAIEFADRSMELISYCAIKTSAELAQERGAYESYKGSKWDRGIFPIDTIDMLEQERDRAITVSRTKRLDWDWLKNYVKSCGGMRNSNLMAVAPTATISTISGCFPCIEPIYKNMYVKSNVSGEFTVLNHFLVEDLKKVGLWDQRMIDELKYYDGDITAIARIPQAIKERYKTAFEIDPVHLIKITAARGKWIDQSQSHNIFMAGMSGSKMHDTYMAAWESGLKTTYYFRTLGASQVEKSTLSTEFGFTQKRSLEVKGACSIDMLGTPDCESCQ